MPDYKLTTERDCLRASAPRRRGAARPGYGAVEATEVLT
jgi:hypothetical protein